MRKLLFVLIFILACAVYVSAQTTGPATSLASTTTAQGDQTNDFNLYILERAPGAATVALAGAGAGNTTNGTHQVKVVFTTATSGHTNGGTASAAVTVVDNAVNGKIAISSIPTGPAFVSGRKIYLTKAGGTTYYLLSNGTIADNTTTTLTANDSDTTLNGAAVLPTNNTTLNPIIQYDGPTGVVTVGGATVGTITGSGTANTLPKFTAATTIGNSAVTDNATTFAIATNKFTVTEASGNTFFAGVLSGGSGPATITDAAGKILSAALNTVAVAQGGTGTGSTLVGLVRGNASAMTAAEISGDATTSGSNVLTLASVISAGGPTGSATVAPIITYDAKGRLTTVSSATITPPISAVTGLGTGVATAAAVNGGSLGAFLLNNLAQDNAFVGDTGGIAVAKSIGSCSAASSALTYNTTTHAWGCNTISSPSGANPTQSVGLSVVNGSAATFMRSDAAPALDQSIAPTMTGAWIFSKNGALSLPTVTGSGTWITGGSATTAKPYVLIEPSGTTSTNWNTSGTGLGLNAASGFAGNLLDLQVAAVQQAKITSAGTFGGLNANITNVSVYATLANALAANSTRTILIATNTGGSVGGIGLDSTYAIRFGTADSGVHDASIWRSAAAEISFAAGANTGSGGSWKATNGTLSNTLFSTTILNGHTSALGRLGESFEVTTSANYGGGAFNTFSTSAAQAPVLDFNRSKSGTKGTQTVVASGDSLGYVIFNGSDGTAFLDAAYIKGVSDGTPGTNDMPGRLEFYTTLDGASTGTLRMKIDNAGHIFMPNISTAAGATGADACFQGSGATQEITTDTALCIVSARRFKNTIQPDHDGLAFIKQLRPVHYFLNEAPERGRQYGFVAEEVEKVNKDFVTYQKDGQIRSVLYIEIISKLTAAVQEQQEEITTRDVKMASLALRVRDTEQMFKEQQAQIQALRKEVDVLKAKPQGNE